MPCFYTPYLTENTKTLVIADDEFHHIRNVFRKKIGEKIFLTSGRGILAEAEIIEISSKKLTISVLAKIKKEITRPKIAAAFSLLKNKHDHLIVEKLTELGVKEFFPITTIRSVRRPAGNTREKFEKTAISAIKQCDNAFLPKIHRTQELTTFLDEIEKTEFIPLIASEKRENNILPKVVKSLAKKPLCIIIGSEGGFADEEFDMFREKQVRSFSLGDHILRAETAAIASISQVIGILLESNKVFY